MPISYERPDRRQEELNLIGKEKREKILLPGKHKISHSAVGAWERRPTSAFGRLLSLALIGQNLTIVTVH